MIVEVVYANAERQALVKVELAAGSTVSDAINLSGILTQFPEIDLQRFKMGIFSKLVNAATPLNAGDRVEIYHPLMIDPKMARIKRAKQQKKLPIINRQNNR